MKKKATKVVSFFDKSYFRSLLTINHYFIKKLLSFIAVFMLFASININATTTKVSNESVLLAPSCFAWARAAVIYTDGEINLSNVNIVLELTAWCESIQ